MLVLYTLAVAYIGIRNSKSRDSEDYFLASRSLPAWLLSITFIASWWGGGSAIDLVDHAHEQGLGSFWIYGVPVLIATALMFVFAGGIRRVATISQPELFERRYDSRTALILTIFIVIFMTIGAAIQVIVIGNLFHSFLGISYEMGALLGTGLVLCYSMFGGFRGVVLTDLFQFVFCLFSTIFLFWLTLDNAGGFAPLVEHAAKTGREGYTSFFHGVGDNIAFVVTFGTSWMIQANIWQRISAAKSPSSARKMMGISFVAFIPLYMMVTLTGMLSLMIFDEVPSGGVVAALLKGLDRPLIGALIFVGLCSAIMSTMDSMFNTGALSLTQDIYKKYVAPNRSARSYVNVGRITTLLIALVALFIGVKIKSVLTISWIGADFLASGAFVPLVLGFVWRRGTTKAALVSMCFGLLFSTYNLLVALGLDLPTAWEIASTEQAIIGITSSLVIYVAVSLLTKPEFEQADRFIEQVQIIKTKKQ